MFYLFLLFIFCYPLSVSSETIYTPYQKVNSITSQEELETVFSTTKYLLEENQVLTENYYPKKTKIKGFLPKLDDFIYEESIFPSTSCTAKDDIETKVLTKSWYQLLQPISSIEIKSDANLFLYQIRIYEKGNLIVQKEKKKGIYLTPTSPIILTLPSKKNIEDLTISFTVFVKQAQEKVSLSISDNKKITYQVHTIKKKGFSTISTSLSKEIISFQYQKKIQTTMDIPPFYSKLIKQQKLCQKRKKLYRFQKVPRKLLSNEKEKQGYHFVKEVNIQEYYRREKIVFKEVLITRTPYLLIDDFIISTSFPLKDLKLSYSSFTKEGTYPITFSYQGFQIFKNFTYKKTVE